MAAQANITKSGKSFVVNMIGREPFKTDDPIEAGRIAGQWEAEAAAAESRASVTGKVRIRLTYRNQFQVVPRGQSNPALTLTRDVMDALIEDWPTIRATYDANKAKVAATYREMPPSVGAEKAKEQPKIDLALVEQATV